MGSNRSTSHVSRLFKIAHLPECQNDHQHLVFLRPLRIPESTNDSWGLEQFLQDKVTCQIHISRLSTHAWR